MTNQDWIRPSIYEPEMFGGYLDLKDMTLYKSSFDLQIKQITTPYDSLGLTKDILEKILEEGLK
jgi:hypothetical protein